MLTWIYLCAIVFCIAILAYWLVTIPLRHLLAAPAKKNNKK